MWKKLLILSLSIVMLLVITVPVDAGDKSVNVNWQITGTIVQTIDVTSPNPPYPQDPVPYSLINLTANGSPGDAKITLLSETSFSPPTGWSFDCLQLTEYPDGPAYFVKNDFVAIFPDQSLLFASVYSVVDVDGSDGYGSHLCFGPTGTDFKVEMVVTGGTGRFEGASGSLTGEGKGYPVGLDSILAGEIGTITGEIKFSDE
jgi:hypothetical protein